ncbi:MAG TPA: glycosyltransferase family 4 protein [Thermoanaerobaculia bacterium]|nr:glycosyltransferase family 4 protein [Thermoanaerobaculia bacterium]
MRDASSVSTSTTSGITVCASTSASASRRRFRWLAAPADARPKRSVRITAVRILQVITRGDEIGGAQMHVLELSKALVNDGHDVMVASSLGAALAEPLTAAGVRVVQSAALGKAINPAADLSSYRFLRHVIREYAPALVATHSSKAGVLGRLAAARERVPCTFTAHGWAFHEHVPLLKRSVYGSVERAMAPLTDRIICVSGYDHALAVKAGMAPRRLVKIANGISDVTESLRSVPGRTGTVRIVMVARFAVPKDHTTLLQAFRNVRGAELLLVGDGPLLERARQMASALGVADRTMFLGARGDVPELLAGGDISVLLSNREGLPISVLEAMRAALPVVVSNVGGAGETIVNGESGFLVERGDVAGVAATLQRLVDDAALRARTGSLARARFLSEFSLRSMYLQTRHVYEDVIAERRRPR